MHRGKVDPGVSELSRDHVNRPLVYVTEGSNKHSKAIIYNAIPDLQNIMGLIHLPTYLVQYLLTQNKEFQWTVNEKPSHF